VYAAAGKHCAMIHVGTSGWQYRAWKNVFYPRGLPQRTWLAHYASVFPTVEVNNSFYRLPKEETFGKWGETTPQGFMFAVKASRYITHIRRLREAKESVELFWSRAAHLRSKLGPVLFQLPPNFKADPPLLASFLRVLPKGMRAAFEFRDDSWQTGEVLHLLDEAGAAWVLADRPGWRVPEILTGGWSYVRFHQGRSMHPGYARSKLRRWADRIASAQAGDTFVYFNNDALGAAPEDAMTLARLLQERDQEVAMPSEQAPARPA
jgi:uncharacterized protein YecE (DUF72 family)